MSLPHKKTIRLYSHGPIIIDPSIEVYWEDVWIDCEVRRKKIKIVPCILGLEDLRAIVNRSLDRYENKDEELLGWLKEDRDAAQEKLDYFKRTNERFFLEENYHENCIKKGNTLACPSIWVNKPLLSRKDFEETIEWYLRKRGILKSQPRFKWNKYKGFCVTPVSV